MDKIDEKFLKATEEKGMQRPEELRWMYERLLALKPKKILEIGTCAGGFTSILANLGAKVITIDINPNPYPIWNHQDLLPYKLDKNITFIQADSQSPKTVKMLKDLGPFDVVIIDAAHEWMPGYHDWLNYSGMATKAIAIHDICHYWEKYGFSPCTKHWDWFPSEFWQAIKSKECDRPIDLSFIKDIKKTDELAKIESGGWGLIYL